MLQVDETAAEPGRAGGSRSRSARLLVAAMIAVHVALIMGNIYFCSPTYDEIEHVQAGIAYWKDWRFDIYRANPPLTKLTQSLPVLWLNPGLDLAAIQDSDLTTQLSVVRTARIAGIFWSLLGAWAIYHWARDLYGERAGCLGLAIWFFEPNLLAHASLATADIGATAAAVFSTYLFVLHLKKPRAMTAVAAGLALGVALATKYTLVILGPIWLALAMVEGNQKIKKNYLLFLIIVFAIFALNYFYFFCDTMLPSSRFELHGRRLVAARRLVEAWFGDLAVPIPLDYVAGLDGIEQGLERGQSSYLQGTWKDGGGWWYYYIYGLAIKVPLGVSALVAWGGALALFGRRSRGAWREEAMLWIPCLALMALVCSQTGLCKHVRYAFPAIPFLLIVATRPATYLRASTPLRGGLVCGLLLWAIGSGLAAYPHGLSYFNESIGGPGNGQSHLLDSNIDWGQDLLGLKRWLADHPEAKSLGLAIFTRIHPAKAGIEFEDVPVGPDPHKVGGRGDPERLGPHPGFYAISVNYLKGMKFRVPTRDGGWREVKHRGEYAYFNLVRPIGRVGFSIYLYRIGVDEANEMRAKLGMPALPASVGAGRIHPARRVEISHREGPSS